MDGPRSGSRLTSVTLEVPNLLMVVAKALVFVLGYGEWIRLFRRNGLSVEALVELRQPAGDDRLRGLCDLRVGPPLAGRGDLGHELRRRPTLGVVSAFP